MILWNGAVEMNIWRALHHRASVDAWIEQGGEQDDVVARLVVGPSR